MATCLTACAIAVPPAAGSGCNVTPRNSTVGKIVIKKCNSEFTLITDLEEWETKITAHEIHATGEVLAQKPKGSIVSTKLSGVRPPVTTGVERSITGQDFNSTPTFVEFDFWNSVDINAGKFHLGWLDSLDNFYGFVEEYSAEVDHIVPDDKNSPNNFDFTIKWNSRSMEKPVNIPGLFDMLA